MKEYTNRELAKMIFPLVIEQFLVMLVGICDTMMISYAGEAAISGVTLVDMLSYLIITVLTALDTGGTVIVSQYLGQKNRGKANETAGQLFLITALFASGIMAFCLLFHRPLLSGLFGQVEAAVMEAAVTYLLITAVSYPFLGIYNSGAALFRSMGKTDVTMYVALLMNGINIVGNAIGIFVFHAGVAGVAVPTLVSRIVAAAVMTWLAFQRSNEIFLTREAVFSWERHTVGQILKIAVPGGIENGLFALGRLLVTSMVALFGTAQIAANGVANSVDTIAILVVNAVNLAIVPIVGQCIGAGEPDAASRYTKKLMGLSYASAAVLGGGVVLGLPFILGFFQMTEETYWLSCILITAHNLLAFALHPTSFNLANSLRAAGDVRITMWTGILSMIVFRLGTAYLLGIVLGYGIFGVWAAMGMDWLARSAVFVVRYRNGRWRSLRAI